MANTVPNGMDSFVTIPWPLNSLKNCKWMDGWRNPDFFECCVNGLNVACFGGIVDCEVGGLWHSEPKHLLMYDWVVCKRVGLSLLDGHNGYDDGEENLYPISSNPRCKITSSPVHTMMNIRIVSSLSAIVHRQVLQITLKALWCAFDPAQSHNNTANELSIPRNKL